MHRGYLPIWRKFFEEHPFWKEKRKFSKAEAWIDILKETHFDDEPKQRLIDGRLITVEYGECVMSTRYCADRWGWTQSSVFRFVKLLKKMEQIESKTNHGPNHFIIINAAKYDLKRIKEESEKNQPRITGESAANQTKSLESFNHGNIFSSDSIEIRLAEFLFNHIRRNNPNAKAPNFHNWAKTFDYILRIDKRDIEDLKMIIRWCQNDSFWLENILSPTSLRKQYDQLWLKMKNENSKAPSPTPTTYAQCQDAERRQMAAATLKYQEQQHGNDIRNDAGRTEQNEHCPLIPEDTGGIEVDGGNIP